MTGKAIIPVVQQSDNTYKINFLDQELVVKNDTDRVEIEKMIKDHGYYPYRVDSKELEELSSDQKRVDALFHELMLSSVKAWMQLADEKLKDTNIKCYVCPGNDDQFEIDEIIEASNRVTNAEGKVIELNQSRKMISTGYSNCTPWKTFRELDEDQLFDKIKVMISALDDVPNSVFNIHVPPYGSGLDEAPELDENLKPKFAGRSTVPVGSTAVKKIIEEYQPLLSLHGHIHEGRGMKKIGRTLCLNPGSTYEQGILHGVLVELDHKGIKTYSPTSG